MTLSLRYAARSDIGLVRGDNQDSVYAGPRLLAVADGIGGNVGGGTASRIVIEALAPLDADEAPDDLIGTLRDAADEANAELRAMIQRQPELDGMGTTLTAILFGGSRLGLLQIGDSRAYLVRGGELSQITHDHTFVQSLVDEGRITPEEAINHPQRSVIMRALTGGEAPRPDLSIREACVGDRYLLCSDGVSDYVSRAGIVAALAIDDPQQAADRLVDLALRAGGPDNITCIVADVVDRGVVDDVPVVDGAAGTSRGRPDPVGGATTAAMATEGRHARAPRRRWRRRVVLAVIALAVVIGGLFGIYRWTQQQYFVGVDRDRVAVYRGLNVSIGGMHLYHRVRTTDLQLADLAVLARKQVSDGLSANSRQAANRIVANLATNEMLPPCPRPTPTPTATPTHRPRHTPAHASRTPAHRSSGRRSARPSRSAPSQQPAHPSTAPAPTLVPGKDCR